MLIIFISHVLSKQLPELDLYKFVPGNWTQTNVNGTELINIQETNQKSTFKGFVNNSEIVIQVLSNKTAQVMYGEEKYTLKFDDQGEGVSISDIGIEDGKHISITIYSTNSFELLFAYKDNIFSYGFNKISKLEYNFIDFLLPTVIGIGFYFLFIKIGKKYMN